MKSGHPYIWAMLPRAHNNLLISIVKNLYKDFLKEKYQQQQLPKDVKLFTTISCEHSIKLAVINKKDEQPNEITKKTMYGLTEETLSEKGLIALNDILKPEQDGTKPVQYVLIDGAPGIGKSTLAWELCHKWEELDSLKQYAFSSVDSIEREEGSKCTLL